MSADSSKITIHMVASLDGYIAKKDNSIDWMNSSDSYEKGVAGENPEEFLKTIDCYVMGARTYEHARELSVEYGWAYGDTPVVVLTHENRPAVRDSVEFYSGDLRQLVNDRLKPKYRSIWMVGGAALVRDCIRLNLADEIRITVVPVILGDGLRFFDHIGQVRALHLQDVTAYRNGMVELWYVIRKE
jgi:dihydrofolate reductase